MKRSYHNLHCSYSNLDPLACVLIYICTYSFNSLKLIKKCEILVINQISIIINVDVVYWCFVFTFYDDNAWIISCRIDIQATLR